MNLTAIYEMTMKEVLNQCKVVDQKIHTNEDGEIQAIEVKYVPKGDNNELKSKPTRL